MEGIDPVVATLRRTGSLGVGEVSSPVLEASVRSRMVSLGLDRAGEYASRLDSGGTELTHLLSEVARRSGGRNPQFSMLEAQTRILRGLSLGASLRQVLELLVLETEALRPGARCSILLVEEECRFRVAASPSLPPSFGEAVDGMDVSPRRGSCGKAVTQGYRTVSQDVLVDPAWADLQDLSEEVGFRACWSEPFYSSTDDVLGTLAMYLDEPSAPSPTEVEVLASMGALAGIAVERKRTEEDLSRARRELEERVRERTESLERANADLRRLSAEMMMVEERERRKLSVDLHDGLSQILVLARMKLTEARDETQAAVARSLIEVEDLVSRANSMVRSLTFQLSPPALYDLGLVPALEWLAEDIEKNYGLVVHVRDEDADIDLGRRTCTSLFRAVRELLVNVAKHARTSSADLCVARDGEYVRIEVADRGISFDPQQVSSGSYGLFAIRERLTYLGGKVDIHSAPGEGTRVRLLAPITERDQP